MQANGCEEITNQKFSMANLQSGLASLAEGLVQGIEQLFGSERLHEESDILEAGGGLDLLVIHQAAGGDYFHIRLHLSQYADRGGSVHEGHQHVGNNAFD